MEKLLPRVALYLVLVFITLVMTLAVSTCLARGEHCRTDCRVDSGGNQHCKTICR